MINNPHEYELMAQVEETHWWYRTLHRRIFLTLTKYFPLMKDISILDAGCGTGGNMLYLQRNGFQRIKGFDLSEHGVGFCRQRGLDVFQGDLRSSPKYFDYESQHVIICSDVLYFLGEEALHSTLNDFYAILKPKGVLILNLPYGRHFRGVHDLAVGISKRFEKKPLFFLLGKTKFILKNTTYWPFILSPFILLSRTLQRFKIHICKNVKIESDLIRPGRFMNNLFYFTCLLEMNLFRKGPMGSSLFLVLQKNG